MTHSLERREPTRKKTLAVIDKYGYFIWVDPLAQGRRNDREQWTSGALYREFFSHEQKVASDGGFRGDGPQVVSFDNLDNEDKALFYLAFKGVRVGVENAFGRVQMWFPILGVSLQYWRYDDEML